MPKRKIQFSYFILGGYLLGILATILLRRGLIFPRDWLEMVGLLVGGWLGWVIVWFDKIAYIFILHPEVQLSQYVNYYIKKKDYKSALNLINKRGVEMDKLTTRSAMFQVTWVVLAVFAITSIGSMFGKILVMGLGLRMLFENWEGYLKNRMSLKRKLFWQIKREISNDELKWYVYGMTGVFVWLTLILV